ncbi:ABC transporter permease [Parasphaerochaeta coccoides]|uniref:Carbohydrate ABC transporter membrane protein 1, CUT1 family n=1 Tax=Parasphaerochaeta coccoides (strain ATCC BAA-1237 / DSM 17374 / SPN1) TaxID=760011 RepID=F4GJ82_PARC1|nr:ABC transporter permease subunit [Parasphaerochaeta coccoides]AEC01722.1 carbohydrate ABC transporter membrane protein 1, CUT1 family [Parasphaerochaeta coccoides DSM 17374]
MHTFDRLRRNPKVKLILRNYDLYLMLLPVIAFYVIFKYIPMYGIQIAFKDYNPGLGFTASPTVGWDNFTRFFSSFRFRRMILNTVLINVYQLLFQFPLPIFFAIIVNEVRRRWFKSTVLNLTYIPHFLSTVVIVALVSTVTNPEYGVINAIIESFGGKPIRFMEVSSWFKTVYIGSGIWQNMGWSSLVYLGALAGIDPVWYEAAQVDGASKYQQIWRITLPCIAPTIMIMLILKIGGIMDLGVDKVLLMQNDLNISSSDVIPVYVYRTGIRDGDFSYAAAIDLFNNVINFILLLVANHTSKRLSGSSLW